MNTASPTDKNRRSKWQERWARTDFDPWWKADGVPKEMFSALARYAPETDALLLDIGCGDGVMTCDLAKSRSNIVGIDFSSAAIDRARENAASLKNPPLFQICDALYDKVPEAPFQAVLDRGCMHALPNADKPRYAANTASQLMLGGYVIIMHKHREPPEEAILLSGQIAKSFGDAFVVRETLQSLFSQNGTTIPAITMVLQRVA